MSKLKRLLLLMAAIGSSFFFTGCFDADVDDSEIPWTRPQSWENSAPGMGSGMGGNTF